MAQRTFLVTAASQGIGMAICARLAGAGHDVVGLARRADRSDFPGTLAGVDLADRAAVAPGPTVTELFRTNNPIGSAGERRYLDAVPVGRFGQPDEIAAALAFLPSEDGGASLGKAIA